MGQHQGDKKDVYIFNWNIVALQCLLLYNNTGMLSPGLCPPAEVSEYGQSALLGHVGGNGSTNLKSLRLSVRGVITEGVVH